MYSRIAAYAVSISIALTLIGLCTAALGADMAHASGLPLHRTSPSWVGVVKPYGLAHVPARYVGSDVQCFSARSGMPYVQRFDPAAGPYWAGQHGHAVAGWDRTNRDFISFVGYSVICASWAT